jgi:hypothetical protein
MIKPPGVAPGVRRPAPRRGIDRTGMTGLRSLLQVLAFDIAARSPTMITSNRTNSTEMMMKRRRKKTLTEQTATAMPCDHPARTDHDAGRFKFNLNRARCTPNFTCEAETTGFQLNREVAANGWPPLAAAPHHSSPAKNSPMSPANRSGSSDAAKCPPWGKTVHRSIR